MFKEWAVSGRVKSWKKKDKLNVEPGWFCMINELQILKENGWAHI